MSAKRPKLKLFLDEGVPDSVGRAFVDAGHEVQLLRESLATGSPDTLVCAAAELSGAVLVAYDADMKKLAARHGIGSARYRKLSLIRLLCRESQAATRVSRAMSLIEHEWTFGSVNSDRRIFIEIGDSFIRTVR